MRRLWFRLDDVLPLAEHAMACFTHHTASRSTHLSPNRPALLWSSSPLMDLLLSNGLPTWHAGNGTEHAAEAYAWRDAVGRYGTAWHDDHHRGYLPLTTTTGDPGPALGLLRGARHSSDRWVTLDIDPADGPLIPAYRVHLVGCRHDLVPAGTTWTPTAVTCPIVGGRPYPALVADGCTSDSSDLIARFDKITLIRMAADLDAMPTDPETASGLASAARPILQFHDEVLLVLERRLRGHTSTCRPTDRITPDDDGRYPLGAYLWPWQTAGTASPEERS